MPVVYFSFPPENLGKSLKGKGCSPCGRCRIILGMKTKKFTLAVLCGVALFTVVSAGCKTTGSDSQVLDAALHCAQKVSDSSCGFYTCYDKLKPCGPQGYVHGYGDRYCQKFQGLCENTLTSERAKKWVLGTTKCLQQDLADLIVNESLDAVSCQQIYDKGFGSHSRCYTTGAVKHGGVSFCTLSTIEWNRVRACVSAGDIFSTAGLKQIVATAARCTPLIGGLFGLQGPDGSADVDEAGDEIDEETLRFFQALTPDELAQRAKDLEIFLEETTAVLNAQ